MQQYENDHDLLIRIDAKLDQLFQKVDSAGIPAKCATHEEQSIAHTDRLTTLESRFWQLLVLAISSGLAAASSLFVSLVEKR